MYYNIRGNIKNKEKIERFEDYFSINIINIKNIISNNNYVPNKYHIFIIREPKIRVIMSQSIKDKIINHLVSYYFLEYVFLLPEYLAFSFSERCLPIDRVHSSTPC